MKPGRALLALAAAVVLAASGLGFALNHFDARRREAERAHELTGGDAARGRTAVATRSCGGCHVIPGVAGANGEVGPSLDGFAGRLYIGGRFGATPDNLVRWIQKPHGVDPREAMPPMRIPEPEARDIAAYLYTLK